MIPEPGKRLGAGVTVGRMYAPATAVVTSPSTGPVTLRQRWDNQLPAGLPIFFDPRLHVTNTFTDHLHVTAHLSFLTGGLALHVVPVRPLVLTIGAQTDGPLTYLNKSYPVAWEGQTSALIQPMFGHFLQLFVGAGLSFGDRRQSVLAERLDVENLDNPFVPTLMILRRELRADVLAGVAYVFPRTRARILVAAQPIFVLGNPGTPQGTCSECGPDVTLVSYSSSWRLATTVSLIVPN